MGGVLFLFSVKPDHKLSGVSSGMEATLCICSNYACSNGNIYPYKVYCAFRNSLNSSREREMMCKVHTGNLPQHASADSCHFSLFSYCISRFHQSKLLKGNKRSREKPAGQVFQVNRKGPMNTVWKSVRVLGEFNCHMQYARWDRYTNSGRIQFGNGKRCCLFHPSLVVIEIDELCIMMVLNFINLTGLCTYFFVFSSCFLRSESNIQIIALICFCIHNDCLYPAT